MRGDLVVDGQTLTRISACRCKCMHLYAQVARGEVASSDLSVALLEVSMSRQPTTRQTAQLPAVRRAAIGILISEAGELSVARLAEEFGVSQDTIRRDLEELDRNGTVKRTYGGAMSTEIIPRTESRLDTRMSRNSAAKDAIAAVVSDLVKPNMSLMINSGTTTLAVARQLKAGLELRIITSNLLLPSTISPDAVSDIFMVGGAVRLNAQGTNGPLDTGLGGDALDLDVHCDLAIIGVSGVQEGRGWLTGNTPEARLMRTMMERCAAVAVVADSSKFEKASFARVADLDAADFFITESAPPPSLKAALDRAGVRLLVPLNQEKLP